jgi:hypothetical protein
MQNTETESCTVSVKDSKIWTANEKSEIMFRVFLDGQYISVPCKYLVYICISSMTNKKAALR